MPSKVKIVLIKLIISRRKSPGEPGVWPNQVAIVSPWPVAPIWASQMPAATTLCENKPKKVIMGTDVDGIYTADPRIFSSTSKLVEKIDYELIQEIASMGAKVMHPLSIKPCADKNIPIFVKNTFNDKAIGTKITNLNESKDYTELTIFYAIQKNETLFRIKSLDMWNSFGFLNDSTSFQMSGSFSFLSLLENSIIS